jgi:AcrR family transcriptional regulator
VSKRRGRPRSYDPEVALDAALDVFWAQGYDATSLEDLRQATGMNRPSLYAAFGDKAAIYGLVLRRFEERVRQALAPILEGDADLRQGLIDYYRTIVGLYAPNGGGDAGSDGRGCFVLTTTSLAAPGDPAAAQALARSLAQIDEALTVLFRRAQRCGEISATSDVEGLVWLAAAIQHSLSLRARSGESADHLGQAAERAADQILATAGA